MKPQTTSFDVKKVAIIYVRLIVVAAALLTGGAMLMLGPHILHVRAQNTLPGRILSSTGDSQGGIIEFNTDASNTVNLTSNTFDGGCDFSGLPHRYKDSHPTVSRDGRLVAFQSTRDGTGFRIFVMNSDGTNLRQLTFKPVGSPAAFPDSDINPVISPDGSKVAFISARSHTSGNSGCGDTPVYSAYVVNTSGAA